MGHCGGGGGGGWGRGYRGRSRQMYELGFGGDKSGYFQPSQRQQRLRGRSEADSMSHSGLVPHPPLVWSDEN